MTRLAGAVADLRARFTAAGLPDAAMEARILIGGLLGLSGTEVFSGGERELGEAELARIAAAADRRLRHEPVHRILGHREFYGMDLVLSADTLEPRPDTEILVETMISRMGQIVAEKGAVHILDLGTGTGAILLALLRQCEQAQGLGSDISEDALATVRTNADRLGVGDRFRAVRSHWFGKISGRFDIIVSNPPYIRTDVIPTLAPEVRDFDPRSALDGGPDGLDAYRTIAGEAGRFLESDGVLGVEIGFDQRDSVSGIFAAAGWRLLQVAADYGGNDRVLIFARPAGNHPEG